MSWFDPGSARESAKWADLVKKSLRSYVCLLFSVAFIANGVRANAHAEVKLLEVEGIHLGSTVAELLAAGWQAEEHDPNTWHHRGYWSCKTDDQKVIFLVTAGSLSASYIPVVSGFKLLVDGAWNPEAIRGLGLTPVPGEKTTRNFTAPDGSTIGYFEISGWPMIGIIPAEPEDATGPSATRRAAEAHLASCRDNLNILATSLRTYGSEHDQHYPELLQQLIPTYLQELPSCPAAGKDTYSSSYKVTRDGESFYICCQGRHHRAAQMEADLPAQDSEEGPQPSPTALTARRRRLSHLMRQARKSSSAREAVLSMIPEYCQTHSRSLDRFSEAELDLWSADISLPEPLETTPLPATSGLSDTDRESASQLDQSIRDLQPLVERDMKWQREAAWLKKELRR